MKIKIFNYVVFTLLFLTSMSCSKFLDVQPRDSIFEEEAFSTAVGAQQALDGIYLRMSDKQLYGETLTMYYADAQGQYYLEKDILPYTFIKRFLNTNNVVKEAYLQNWTSVYKLILDINNFCQNLEESVPAGMTEEKHQNMLGEAYAVRGMLYLDLLRLYGPVPAKGLKAPAIPYVNSVGFEVRSITPFDSVMTGIITDLSLAREKLKTDLLLDPSQSSSFVERKWRLNYFATSTLLARAYLYAGMKTEAWDIFEAEKDVIDAKFPSITGIVIGDRVFSSEVLFGIENRELHNTHLKLFNSTILEANILRPDPQKLGQVYPESNDYRERAWFEQGTEGNKNYKVFNKYSDKDIKPEMLYFQPLIRKSELSLIGAETAPTTELGYQILNEFRITRGLDNISDAGGAAGLQKAILQEYEREFWGEGQFFFVNKRLDSPLIPDELGSLTISMSSAKYVMPIPDDERKYR
ncbi:MULTISPECIES: RagB/SusD family nutrient uptake outer membrane protein [unclassified Sphingobacterium]|uniref:RagB/SusD family nutrient uptake outer membrane protein n=1 Tax=unclassified Sphingobacterium TaxID=2609468 RepID=UPI00104D41F2|nr:MULTISPECIES: RagB/SusD family nutrient uptake outer membrane protein [unclassified Sphingobacterium]MCS3556552.1 hypothetical protein [Sphingobacterium sp. JUb21]TCQ99848.1 putative outer membrane starch-binding protein [Sphingobacterium sp. JUb20]